MRLFETFGFRRTKTAATPKPTVIAKPFALPYSRMTLDDWRASPERVSYVLELLRTPIFLELVGMLSNIRPLHPRGTLDATTAATLLGQRLGHDQVIATLLAAGTQPPAPPAEVPADYGAENAMKGWETEGDAP